MKIFVEGGALFFRRTGVGQYTKRLLDALLVLDQKNQYTVFGFLFLGRKLKDRPLDDAPNLRYRFIRYLPSKVFNRIRQYYIPPMDVMLGAKPDLFIFPNFVRFPLAFKAKSITVVYDMSFELHKQYVAKANQEYLSRYVPVAVKRSDHIVTISRNSKREIVEFYGVSEDKVTIVNPALDHDVYNPRPDSEVAEVKRKFKIDSKYVLYTGTLEPRKNIVGILDAYAGLDEKVRAEYALVLAGGKGWRDEQIARRLEELKDLNIIITGYVEDEDLPALYSGAALFVFPSFYEGWGMPPLEAMACGTPVISADNSSLPEVVGKAGILLDAKDTAGLTKAMRAVLTDEKLAASLREGGLKHAQNFTWQTSAKVLLEVIKRVGATK
jgi:glycosyltransferase involved in cell wall biosynthesis